MMSLHLGKPIGESIHWAERINYAISGNLLDQRFELSSVNKFSLVTAQQMKCSQLDSEYSLVESCVGIGSSRLTSKSGPPSTRQRKNIRMTFHWRADSGQTPSEFSLGFWKQEL